MEQVHVKKEINLNSDVSDTLTLKDVVVGIRVEADSMTEKIIQEEIANTLKVESKECLAEIPVLSKSALKRKKKTELFEQRKKERRWKWFIDDFFSLYFNIFVPRIKERENRKKKKLENPNHSSNGNGTLSNPFNALSSALELKIQNFKLFLMNDVFLSNENVSSLNNIQNQTIL